MPPMRVQHRHEAYTVQTWVPKLYTVSFYPDPDGGSWECECQDDPVSAHDHASFCDHVRTAAAERARLQSERKAT